MKFTCMFNHRFKKLKDVEVEDFENENKHIKTLTCKDCGKNITFIVTSIKPKFNRTFNKKKIGRNK